MTLPPVPDSAAVNRLTWSAAAAIGDLSVDGYSDPGETVALAAFADAVRGLPVLDIGVGTGRTTALLRLATSSYVAVDFVPEMVETASRRFPGEDIRLGDARDLATLADGSFSGAVFSFNGIDAVGHGDRADVYAAVRRVLRPGGVFLYSTLHKDGPAYRARPWWSPPLPWVVGSLAPSRRPGPMRLGIGLVRASLHPQTLRHRVGSWRTLRRQAHDGGDWATAPNVAHDFGLLTHFTTVSGEITRLQAAGFELLATYAAEDGRPVHEGPVRRDVRWFHVLARSVGAGLADGDREQL